MREWKQLSIDEAKAHPLYGVKGWLLVVLVLLALGALNVLYGLLTYSETAAIYGAYTPLYIVVSAVGGLIGACLAYLGFTRDRRFPKYVVTWLYVVIALGAFNLLWTPFVVAAGMRSFVIGAGILGLVHIALLIWYFRASKRVNVTYFHRERAGA
ncbi:MAG: DUF2569 family protein [Enhydrobacter sp.]|nr:MAG: DUF2569 family protein [Enhydrobacter sp.]